MRQILKGVNAKQAQAHPIAHAHSIWELVSHVDAWVKFALDAVDGTPIPAWPAMPAEMDWPPVSDASARGWKQAVDSFVSHHLKLVKTIKAFGDERLKARVPGRSYNFYQLFQGTIQHAVYHAGQIAMLKKFPPA